MKKYNEMFADYNFIITFAATFRHTSRHHTDNTLGQHYER